MISQCKWCGKTAKLTTCDNCGFKSMINTYPEVFQETIKDMMKMEVLPKLNEITSKFDDLIMILRLKKLNKSNNRKL